MLAENSNLSGRGHMDDRTSKGGKARAANLTPEQRSEIARRAGQARWRKPSQPSPAVTSSQPAERIEATTHDFRQVYGTPSPTTQVTTAWSASLHSFVITPNKKAESSTQ